MSENIYTYKGRDGARGLIKGAVYPIEFVKTKFFFQIKVIYVYHIKTIGYRNKAHFEENWSKVKR